MFDDLTNDSNYLILTIYKLYLRRRKSGESIINSKMFSPNKLYESLSDTLILEDYYELIRELDKSGYLIVKYANNVPKRIIISDKTIRACEQQFKNRLETVLDVLIKLKQLISPIN